MGKLAQNQITVSLTVCQLCFFLIANYQVYSLGMHGKYIGSYAGCWRNLLKWVCRLFSGILFLFLGVCPVHGQSRFSIPNTPVAGGGDGNLEKVVLQLKWKHQFQFAGYYAAVEQGYYREAGLDVDVRELDPVDDYLDILLNGDADYAVSTDAVVLRYMKGDPLVVLAAIYQHSPLVLLTRKDSGIVTPQDINGHKISGAIGAVAAMTFLAAEGIDDSRYEIIRNMNSRAMYDALADGSTDVIVTYVTDGPYQMEEKGVSCNIIRPLTYGIDFYGDCLVTTRQEVEQRPERVRAFRKASLRGWEYAMSHPEEIIDLLIDKYHSELSRHILTREYEEMRRLILPDLIEIGHLNPGRWKHIADTYVSLGMASDGDSSSLEKMLYDPDPEMDREWIYRAIKILGASFIAISLFTIFLARFNRKLKKEVAERKQAQQSALKLSQVLRNLVEVTSSQLGDEFFKAIAIQLSKNLNADYTIIGEVHGNQSNSIKTIAVTVDGELADNFEYELAGTPCENVAGQSLCSYVSGVADEFPEDIPLKKMGVEGYVGVPLVDSQGVPLGIMIALFRKPIDNVDFIESILQVFSLRVGSELGRLQSDQSLIESEARIHGVVDHAPIGIITIDENGKIDTFNAHAEQMFGYSASNMIGGSINALLPEPDANSHGDHLQRYLMTGVSEIIGIGREVIGKRKEGSTFPIYIHVSEFWVGNRRLFTGIVRDISARRQAQEEILKLSQTVEQSSVGIIITDLMGIIEYVNPKFVTNSGYTAEEVIGLNPRLLTAGDMPAEHFRELWETITAGRVWNGELHNRNKSGGLYWVKTTISPLKDLSGNIINYFSVDENITERKRLEEQLRVSQKLETIGTMAGGIAHEFNNILTPVLSYLGLVLNNKSLSSQDRLDILHAFRGAERARDLVKQILEFSRKGELHYQLVSLATVINEGLDFVRSTIPTTIRIKKDILAKCLPVKCDSGQIHQVFMNLVTNACQAMTGSDETLYIALDQVDVGADQAPSDVNLAEGSYARLTVSDTGYGMDSKMLDRIFDPFFTTKEVGKGTGLGLSVSYGIIASHDGEITVESELGCGSKFCVYLPLVEGVDEVQEPICNEEICQGSGRILIVDDDVSIASVGKRVLESLGYSVTVEHSGAGALERIRKAPDRYDLVVTDQTMPRMRGDELIEKLKDIRPDLAVILMTGYSERINEAKALTLGFADFVKKPFNKEEIGKAVAQALSKVSS